MADLFSVLREGSCATQKIIVGFSGGKDSVAMLDLCKRYFKHVYCYNMYLVDKLQMQEGYFRYIEQKYDVKILHLPHYRFSNIYYFQEFSYPSEILKSCPEIYFSDIENYCRDYFDCKWFAYGMMASESLERNAMLKNNGGIDYEHNKLYPLAFWNNQKVYAYLKNKNIKLPPEYQYADRSGNDPFVEFTQILLKNFYPSDWERAKFKFPFIETKSVREQYQIKRWEDAGRPDPRKKR